MNENRTSTKENLRVQVEYTVSGKQVNYAILTVIAGIFGFSSISNSDAEQKANRPDTQYYMKVEERIIKLEAELASIKKSKKATTEIATENTKFLQKTLK